jgi:HD-GYP domain-containing protein (c-di-GMP phosphodiesterase class II)
MSSDRPYRKGMPEEKVVRIFKEGAGSQWDAAVVDAFFRTLDDIRQVSQRERAGLSLDVQQWAKMAGVFSHD